MGAEGRSALLEQLARTRTPAGDPAAGSMEPGTIVDERPGRYILKGVISRGGQSVVHLALDQRLGRPVAFGQPIGDPAPEPVTPGLSSREVRFVREARLATSGRSAEAPDRLEHAIAADIPAGLRAGLATDPDLAALQGEPRFQALTAEGGKPAAAAK